ncbi:hypothetical protein B5M09_000215 [Aphanomyces astaci]|nr:hypothetical protein B5M09_000215 [Aphanomyces astaci]
MKNLRLEDLKRINPKDTSLSLAEVDSIHLAMIALIEELGARIHVNQIIICTAIILYKRFYLTQSFTDFDPRLVVCTVMVLATKIEEFPVRLPEITSPLHELTTSTCFSSSTSILTYPPVEIPEDKDAMYDFTEKDVIECEFYVIEATQYDLVIHHPFSTLVKVYEEVEETFPMYDHSFKTAWDLCLFAYRTHIVLLRPPFLVALAVVYLALQDACYDTSDYLDRVNIKSEHILQVVAELQSTFVEVQSLMAAQSAALAKLEHIVPDPTKD